MQIASDTFRDYYDNPEEAIRKGKSRKAIGILNREYCIVFETRKTPYVAHRSSPGLPVRNATSREIDTCRKWSNLVR